jgi:hypothetical protein
MTTALRQLHPVASLCALGAAALGTLWAAGFALLPDYVQLAVSAAGTADWRETVEFWTTVARHALPTRL